MCRAQQRSVDDFIASSTDRENEAAIRVGGGQLRS